ncbi:GMC family oxidoreductase [Lujinxingia vulgaris]|uniref:GMC family oxidoreductase n=1 Tax=Lujinxingia vulgaris TaxID=2600176 RepID=A0A5C6X3J1_9DELT|nr:GMC family oxidoreductase [Lujinxingia vulgaris]TXD34840.1 GMC family oxidoreductase [Lujinxingia vulgaris]
MSETILDYSAEDHVGAQLQTYATFEAQQAPQKQHHKVDVAIVGAGPGGLVCAATLAAAGLSVLIVDEGRFWPRHSFKRKQSWAAKHLMQEQGTRVMQGNAFIPLASGRGVGGGTLVNSAICFRAPDAVLEEWVEQWGLAHFRSERRDRLFSEVEEVIGAAPTPAALAGENARVAQRGFSQLGLEHAFMPRNAPGCVGCGTCQTGCPTGGKATADITWLPRALRHNARLFADTRCERLTLNAQGRVTGLIAHTRHPETRQVRVEHTIEADRTLLAAGAVNTPILLLNQGLANSSGQVGLNLRVHPTVAVLAKFDAPIRLWAGATQGYYAHHPDDPEILLETFSASPDVFLSQAARAGVDVSAEFLREFRHMAACGLLIRDSSSGQVSPGKDQRAKVRYRLEREDQKKLTAGLHTLVEMFFEAGSRRVMPMVRKSRFFESVNAAHDHVRIHHTPGDLSLYASHPMGTCRIGDDPELCVARVQDGRTYDHEGLYIVDSSLFPSALGANPQVTIMAQALALSRAIAEA